MTDQADFRLQGSLLPDAQLRAFLRGGEGLPYPIDQHLGQVFSYNVVYVPATPTGTLLTPVMMKGATDGAVAVQIETGTGNAPIGPTNALWNRLVPATSQTQTFA